MSRRNVALMAVGTVVTVDPERRIIENGAVAIDAGEIVAVGKEELLRTEFEAKQLLGGSGSLLIPGLINAHQHLTGDGLIRSAIPDHVSMQTAVFDWVMPVHAVHEPEDDALTATLGLVESLLAGITTTVEAGTVAHPDQVLDAHRLVGSRGVIGTWGMDAEGVALALPWQEVLERQQAVIEMSKDDALVDGWVTLVGHDLMSDELLEGAAELAQRQRVGLSFHMSPTTADVRAYLDRTGLRPLQHLQRLGVLGSNVLVAHAVHVDEAEVEVLSTSDTAVAYCPWAYLRLAQGVGESGRHLQMIERGVRVALGCDSENAGDAIDLLLAARLAAGLARDATTDPVRFGAHAAFELATIGGAKALGWDDRVGSIEVGKRADLVVIDRTGLSWQPWSPDPVLQLVWGADGGSVHDVVIDGEIVVQDRCVQGVDLDGLLAAINDRRKFILQRSGVKPVSRWPVV